MRRVFFSALVLALGAASSARAQTSATASGSTKGPGGIVAIVGDDVITRAELDKRIERRRALLLQRIPASAIEREIAWIERDVLESMMDTKLLLLLARQEEKKGEGAYILEADVDAEIGRQVEKAKKGGERVKDAEDLYRHAREAEGISREEYRKAVKEELSIQKYLWFKVYKTNDEFVPPQALKSFYLSHIDDFTTPIEVSFRYITIKLSRDNRVDVLVDFVKKGLKEGKDFVELARKVAEYQGEDPEQAAVLFTKSFDALQSWVKPTADVLKTLKKGEVSDVVPTPLDVRFFKVENLKQGDPKKFEEVQEEIARRIREKARQSTLESFMDRQRRKVRIQVFLPDLPDPTAKKVEKAPAGEAKTAGN
jgi:parvulin-like peptidyl-prolyl isomerase